MSASLEVVMARDHASIEAGTLEGLIDRMITYSAGKFQGLCIFPSTYQDPFKERREVKIFRDTFLATYLAFTTGDVVLEVLISRFQQACYDALTTEQKIDIQYK